MTSKVKLRWNPLETERGLANALRALSEEYPLLEKRGRGISVRFEKSASPGALRVSRAGNDAVVSYGSTNMALRAVMSLMSGLVPENSIIEESSPFKTFGIMLDCSRNAVMTVEHLKLWLRRLSMLGYNMAMLYTEDTYELPDEPFFGYMRGAYTAEELKEIDAYADALGIEMVACIQTLGHLEQILFWPSYGDVRDTSSVLLVDEKKTYALVDKMIALWSSAFKSRRIHVGMDETHDLGRGRFMDRFGYQRGFDIFNRHLSKVVEICQKHGLNPMIWSDMYFRMGSKRGDYYDTDCAVPADVASAIPKEAQLVYWDYYHEDKAFYLDWIERHRKMGFEPVMGSGVWTWGKFWCDAEKTDAAGVPCLEASREAGLREIFFTMWGDDGGYCAWDSAFIGLAAMAEKAFTGHVDTENMKSAFKTVFNADYEAASSASAVNQVLYPPAVLWDDPLQMIYLHNEKLIRSNALSEAAEQYLKISRKLRDSPEGGTAGNTRHIALLAEVLAMKVALADRLIRAYAAGDAKELYDARDDIRPLTGKMEDLEESFRAVWMATSKPFGFETVQIRMAGQIARLHELDRRLAEMRKSKHLIIPELEANRNRKAGRVNTSYKGVAAGTRIQ